MVIIPVVMSVILLSMDADPLTNTQSHLQLYVIIPIIICTYNGNYTFNSVCNSIVDGC